VTSSDNAEYPHEFESFQNFRGVLDLFSRTTWKCSIGLSCIASTPSFSGATIDSLQTESAPISALTTAGMIKEPSPQRTKPKITFHPGMAFITSRYFLSLCYFSKDENIQNIGYSPEVADRGLSKRVRRIHSLKRLAMCLHLSGGWRPNSCHQNSSVGESVEAPCDRNQMMHVFSCNLSESECELDPGSAGRRL